MTGGRQYRELEELVRYVSCRVAQSLSRGMGENHRSNRDLQRVTGCLGKGGRFFVKRGKIFIKRGDFFDKKSPGLNCGRGPLSSRVGSSPLSVSEKFLSAFLVGSSHVTHLFNHQIYNHSDRVKIYSQETKGRLFEMIFRTILKNLWSIKFIEIDLI